LEVLPHQLQLKQTGPGETWLAFPVDERGYNPESNSYVPLVKFPVALKPPKRDKPVGEKAPAKKAAATPLSAAFDLTGPSPKPNLKGDRERSGAIAAPTQTPAALTEAAAPQ